MKVVKFMFAVVVVAAVVEVVPSVGGRVVKMKEKEDIVKQYRKMKRESKFNVVSVYDKGPVPPSGPSTCTYIPGTGGSNCPPVKEINILPQNTHQTSYPRLVVPFAVATNQH